MDGGEGGMLVYLVLQARRREKEEGGRGREAERPLESAVGWWVVQCLCGWGPDPHRLWCCALELWP